MYNFTQISMNHNPLVNQILTNYNKGTYLLGQKFDKGGDEFLKNFESWDQGHLWIVPNVNNMSTVPLTVELDSKFG